MSAPERILITPFVVRNGEPVWVEGGDWDVHPATYQGVSHVTEYIRADIATLRTLPADVAIMVARITELEVEKATMQSALGSLYRACLKMQNGGVLGGEMNDALDASAAALGVTP